jgi:hypothetical protein
MTLYYHVVYPTLSLYHFFSCRVLPKIKDDVTNRDEDDMQEVGLLHIMLQLVCVGMNFITVDDPFTSNISPIMEATIAAAMVHRVPSKTCLLYSFLLLLVLASYLFISLLLLLSFF